MLKREQEMRRNIVEILCMEDRIPKDHLLRKIDQAVDSTHIYDLVEDLYCQDNRRASIDPVALFKCVLIQHLYGIPSLRRTMAEIDMNIAYRWFLGYAVNDELPHFSTISYNFRNRFEEETIEKVFRWILWEANQAGYLSPEVVYIDGTHIKANANVNKRIKKVVPVAAARYRGTGSLPLITTRLRPKRRRSRYLPPTLRVVFSTKENTSSSLPKTPDTRRNTRPFTRNEKRRSRASLQKLRKSTLCGIRSIEGLPALQAVSSSNLPP